MLTIQSQYICVQKIKDFYRSFIKAYRFFSYKVISFSFIRKFQNKSNQIEAISFHKKINRDEMILVFEYKSFGNKWFSYHWMNVHNAINIALHIYAKARVWRKREIIKIPLHIPISTIQNTHTAVVVLSYAKKQYGNFPKMFSTQKKCFWGFLKVNKFPETLSDVVKICSLYINWNERSIRVNGAH